MALAFTWNGTFEAQPADNEALSLGAGRIRDLKSAISERAEIDHNWNGGTDDGQHKKVTFGAPLGAKPTAAADTGFVYTKDVSAKVELHWEDEDGNEIQLTSAGKLLASILDINALTEESGIASGDFLPFWDTTASAVRKVDYDDLVALPRGYIDGLILSNNTTDAAKDIDIAAGDARDGSNAANMSLSSTLVKQIDAAWAVGTNQGGMDTGAVAANTFYHVWLIRRSDTGVVDALFSTSGTAPTMPTNYDQKRRLGAVLTDATPNILAFLHVEDDFYFDTPLGDYSASNPGTAAVTVALTVPTGIKVMPIIGVKIGEQSGTSRTYWAMVSDPDQADVAPSSSVFNIANEKGNGDVFSSGNPRVRTNTSGQVRFRISASVAATSVNISTHGWKDPRGRNA